MQYYAIIRNKDGSVEWEYAQPWSLIGGGGIIAIVTLPKGAIGVLGKLCADLEEAHK